LARRPNRGTVSDARNDAVHCHPDRPRTDRDAKWRTTGTVEPHRRTVSPRRQQGVSPFEQDVAADEYAEFKA
jgi:hypothetical protein